MGRRWGKTILGGVIGIASAAQGAKVAWIVPVYKNGRPLWRWARQVLGDLVASGRVRRNESDRTFEFESGGFLGIYSTDNEDSIRGESFHVVILDEAAKIAETAWTDAILPTLADFGGHAILISTPRGQNWFATEWKKGNDPYEQDVASFQAPSSDNPNPRIKLAALKARDRVPERTYRQEWLAEFVDDAGGVFKGVRGCIRGQLEHGPAHPATRYVMGVDLAKYNDYTVCVVIDEVARQVVDFQRWNLSDWPVQKARIAALAEKWNDALVWMDTTGLGDPIFDDLSRAGMRINSYKFSATSKRELLEKLMLLIEQQNIYYPEISVLINELSSYEYERLPSGGLRMNAPSGMHDDTVIALGLACWPLLAEGAQSGISSMAVEQLRTNFTDLNTRSLLKKVF